MRISDWSSDVCSSDLGIQLQRHRSWCVSTDPEFAAKAADVIGLYLNPPQNALVLSVDEKPSIQALERARGYVQNSSGKIVQGMKSTYKRHGQVDLSSDKSRVGKACVRPGGTRWSTYQ